jgi:hypothetical protein
MADATNTTQAEEPPTVASLSAEITTLRNQLADAHALVRAHEETIREMGKALVEARTPNMFWSDGWEPLEGETVEQCAAGCYPYGMPTYACLIRCARRLPDRHIAARDRNGRIEAMPFDTEDEAIAQAERWEIEEENRT